MESRLTRVIGTAMVLILMITISGYSKPIANTIPWTVGVYNYDFTDAVETAAGSKQADAGHKWLVLEVSVANKNACSEGLNPFIYEFEFNFAGQCYINQLVWDNPIGGLRWSQNAQPGQTIRGDLYFQAPASLTGLCDTQLVMRDTIRGNVAGWDISSVPRR